MIELLALIATVLLPPLGVAIKKGLGTDFIINLVLTLLFYIPGLVHAVYVNYMKGGTRALA